MKTYDAGRPRPSVLQQRRPSHSVCFCSAFNLCYGLIIFSVWLRCHKRHATFAAAVPMKTFGCFGFALNCGVVFLFSTSFFEGKLLQSFWQRYTEISFLYYFRDPFSNKSCWANGVLWQKALYTALYDPEHTINFVTRQWHCAVRKACRLD